MFRLVPSMRRGLASGRCQASSRYVSVEAAHAGANELLREDRVLRVVVERNPIPQSFVEWLTR
jgi:hypothetical protein